MFLIQDLDGALNNQEIIKENKLTLHPAYKYMTKSGCTSHDHKSNYIDKGKKNLKCLKSETLKYKKNVYYY